MNTTGSPQRIIYATGTPSARWFGHKPGLIRTNTRDLLESDPAWLRIGVKVVSNGGTTDGSAIAHANKGRDLDAITQRVTAYITRNISRNPRRAMAALKVLAALAAI